MRIPRPLKVIDWFDWWVQRAERELDAADRSNLKVIRYDFTKADAGSTISIGALPENAVVIKAISGVYVHEAFNAGTNNRLDIGTAADTDFFGTDLSLLAIGFVPLDEAVSLRPSETVATEIKIVVDVTGTAATTGKASAMVFYTVLPEAA